MSAKSLIKTNLQKLNLKNMTAILIIPAIIIFLIIIFYNQLVRRKNEVDNATGSINAMLKNRFDLIPNLVDTIKTYMVYETELLTKLTSMRTMALDGRTSESDKLKINNEISSEMRKIMISVENYPDLKASNNFLQLQESWTDMEDRISASRRFYNNAVTDYNNAVKSFPQNIIAGMMGYKLKQVFEISAEEAKNLNSKALFSK